MSELSAVLKIEDVSVVYQDGGTTLQALRDVSLEIEPQQVYALVGESGSGKSTLALAVMQYLGEEGKVTAGRILVNGDDIQSLDEAGRLALWGKSIALAPQNPYSALNPSMPVGDQIVEGLTISHDLDPVTAAARARYLLEEVRMADPSRIMRSYPHQLSGGQQQRVLIAMALSAEPDLLVLDEPTSSLDVTTEAAVLDLIDNLMDKHGTAALYVTHNLGVVAGIADRVAVLYASELVEDAATEDLYHHPLHPYTRGLLDSLPHIARPQDRHRVTGIAGAIPPLNDLPPGCVFAPRCPIAVDQCFDERPPLDRPQPGRKVRCHRWPEILSGEVDASRKVDQTFLANRPSSETLLQIDEIEVDYEVNNRRQRLSAVDGVDLRLNRQGALGIVGESGSGKSSLARAIIGLVEANGGEMTLLGVSLPANVDQRTKATLQKLQMVFQNPSDALNPYLTVGEALSRPFITLLGLGRAEAMVEAGRLLTAVKLPLSMLDRYPAQLSGGERQRVAIARAFAAQPELLLTDEPVSALDVSVRANVLNLLSDLQREGQTASITISHDISVIAYLADEVAVMYLGKLMEHSAAADVFDRPYHPYTEALLSAIPFPDPAAARHPVVLPGDIPSALKKPSGCPFHTRCPRVLGDVCKTQAPPWQTTDTGKRIYCHIPLDELAASQIDLLPAGEGGAE